MTGREDHDLPLANPLTPREEDILRCIAEEMSNRQIAEQLVVSINTVKWYARQIYSKLGVGNRFDAIARARRLGLLPDEPVGTVRHNLPVPATPFIGRERELAQLTSFIVDPQVRVITITGPGGMGKTRLALEAAGRALGLQTQFNDGVFFVSLAPLESAGDIVTTLADALGFQFPGSGMESEQLLNYLRQKRMLLIVDNIEHILEGQTLLADINSMAAGITLVVTSRERLQLRGEQHFPLHGLALAQTAESAAEAPAAMLFLHTARRTEAEFQLLEGDAEHLLHICHLVEGMPLGLELAASWVSLLPLSEIAAEIEKSLNLLAAEHSDAPQRHQSMQAALDVSWRRLTAEQQRAFQELTVFRGDFTREAAVAVANASLPLLVTLVNKSWLSYDRQNDRYHIHALLRQYGASMLCADSAHEQEVRQRHAAYFCAYLQARESDWHGPRQLAAAMEVRAEIDNIQPAWRWAVTRGKRDLLAQGLNSLCTFYNREGRLVDAQNACRLAVDGLTRSPVLQGADDAECLALLSQVLAWESDFFLDVERREDLLSQSQQMLDQAAQSGRDTQAEQANLLLFHSYAASQRDLEETKRLANLGLEMFRDLGDKIGEAEALKMVGRSHLYQGDLGLADHYLHRSLQISQQLGDTEDIAIILTYLGMAARQRGDFEEAETLTHQGIGLFRQIENRYNEELNLARLSNILIQSGKFSAARETMAQAMEIARDLGTLPPLFPNHFATAALHLGNYTDAQAMADEGLKLAKQKGALLQAGWALECLGDVSLVMGDPEQAERYLQESVAVLKELRHVYQSLAKAVLSYVYRALGKVEKAHQSLLSALQLGTKTHTILPIIMCLPIAALLAADDDRPERAVELYSLAQRFGHIRNSHWYEDVACRELDGVCDSLSPGVLQVAKGKGMELDVWETAHQLMEELTHKV